MRHAFFGVLHEQVGEAHAEVSRVSKQAPRSSTVHTAAHVDKKRARRACEDQAVLSEPQNLLQRLPDAALAGEVVLCRQGDVKRRCPVT